MRLIDGDALIEAHYDYCNKHHDETAVFYGWSMRLMKEAPSAQPEPSMEECACCVLIKPQRKKGNWEITEAYPHNVYCSECHKKFAQTHWAVWEDGSLPRNFCPNCGAEMEEDGERA